MRENQQQTHRRFKPSKRSANVRHALATMHRVPNIDNAICYRERERQLELYAEHSTNGKSKGSWRIDAAPVLPGVTILLKRWAFVETEGQLDPSHPSDHDQHVHARSVAQCRFRLAPSTIVWFLECGTDKTYHIRCFWPSRQCLSFPVTHALVLIQSIDSICQDRKFQAA
jgi:hypothetical protein